MMPRNFELFPIVPPYSEPAANDTQPITEELCRSYYSKRYSVCIHGRRSISLKPLEFSERLEHLLKDKDIQCAALMSACNPLSRHAPLIRNLKKQVELIEEVSTKWEYLEGECKSRHEIGLTEPHVLILGIDLENARSLAKKYGQLIFLFIGPTRIPQLIATNAEEQVALDPFNELQEPLPRLHWLKSFIFQAYARKWCNKIFCTTCGCKYFRTTLFRVVCRSAEIDISSYPQDSSLEILNSDDRNKAITVVKKEIRGMSPSGLEHIPRDYWLMCLGLIFFELRLWSPGRRMLWTEELKRFKEDLGASFADQFFELLAAE